MKLEGLDNGQNEKNHRRLRMKAQLKPQPKVVKTMTAGAAFDIAVKSMELCLGTNWQSFTEIGWLDSKDAQCGPYLVTKVGSKIIEIDRHGTFKDIYPAKADRYFPWITAKVKP
jgi:hypothetical protein